MHLKRDEWTDTAPLTELSKAIAFISTLSRNLGLNHTTEVRISFFFVAFAQFFIEVRLLMNWGKRLHKNDNCLTRWWRWTMKLMRISKENFHNVELDWKRILRSRRRLRQNWEELRTMSSCNIRLSHFQFIFSADKFGRWCLLFFSGRSARITNNVQLFSWHSDRGPNIGNAHNFF